MPTNGRFFRNRISARNSVSIICLVGIIHCVTVLQRPTNLLSITPLLADGLFLLVAIRLFTPLVHQLTVPSGINALLVSMVFVLFCFGVYYVRKLHAVDENDVPDEVLPSKVRGVLAFLFGLVMAAVIAHQLGYFASIQVTGIGDINEGATAAFYSFAPGAWLGFAMFYVLVLAFPVRPTLSFPASKYTFVALVGLSSQQVMLLVMAAELAAVLSAFSSFWGPVIFTALLLALFLPPRILYAICFASPGTPLFIGSVVSLLLPIIYCTLQLIVVN